MGCVSLTTMSALKAMCQPRFVPRLYAQADLANLSLRKGDKRLEGSRRCENGLSIGVDAVRVEPSCEVTVYQTKNQAMENGMTKEICIVEGSSAFSFDHSTEGAIKNHINKLCQCRVRNAYMESAHTESQMGMKGISYINLVGFK
ncbi:transposase [Pseudomonas sp. IT-196MI5]